MSINTEYHDSLTRENDFPAASAPMRMGAPPIGMPVGPIEEFLNRLHDSIVDDSRAGVKYIIPIDWAVSELIEKYPHATIAQISNRSHFQAPFRDATVTLVLPCGTEVQIGSLVNYDGRRCVRISEDVAGELLRELQKVPA